MTVINQIMVEALKVVARDATSTTVPATTDTSSASATSTSASGGGNTATQSPLLFFVALGFGVVFTNLWYGCTVHSLSTFI
jgi:hypothetical protein